MLNLTRDGWMLLIVIILFTTLISLISVWLDNLERDRGEYWEFDFLNDKLSELLRRIWRKIRS